MHHVFASPLRHVAKVGGILLLLLALGSLNAKEAAAQISLYADPIAQRPGDVLTVILSERTSAQRRSNYRDRSASQVGGSGAVAGGGFSGTFGLDAEFDRSSRTANETAQSELLTGTFTATVVDTDEAGNLLIKGERSVSVNGVTHLMRVEGTVRPFDVRFDNTVRSYQIANANVEYRQAGLHRRLFRPGTLVRTGALALLGAAAYFAITQ